MKYLTYFTTILTNKPAEINTMFYCWLIAALCFLMLEMGHPGLFFFLSFFFGGIAAAGVSCLTDSVMIQGIVFFASTGVALAVLRYAIVPLLGKGRPHEQTNVYALRGKQGFVVQPISAEYPGLVRVNGELWAARVVRDELNLEKGAAVEVIDVRGAHVVVKKSAHFSKVKE